MKLTKKFWMWVSQVLALTIFGLRVDLVVAFIKLLPLADVSPLYPLFHLLALVAIVWCTWLIWRAYIGFYKKMDFWIDETCY